MKRDELRVQGFICKQFDFLVLLRRIQIDVFANSQVQTVQKHQSLCSQNWRKSAHVYIRNPIPGVLFYAIGLLITRLNDYGARCFVAGGNATTVLDHMPFFLGLLGMESFSTFVYTFISSFSLAIQAWKASLLPSVSINRHFPSLIGHKKRFFSYQYHLPNFLNFII